MLYFKTFQVYSSSLDEGEVKAVNDYFKTFQVYSSSPSAIKNSCSCSISKLFKFIVHIIEVEEIEWV